MPIDSPTHPDRPTSRPRLPLGLLGMVVLICGVETSVMRHDYDLTTLIASNWQIEGRAPERLAAKNQILCFGDSMVKFGIQPRILETALQKPSYNFALYCGSAPASYTMLRRSFDAGSKPAAVIVDFQPELLMGDSMRILNRVYPELLTFGEIAELCWNARNPDRFAEFVIARILPSARKRYEIRASVVAAIQGGSASVKDKLLAARRNWKINQGGEVLAKNPYYHGEVPETGAYPAMFWTPWKADPLNDQYLNKFLKLAETHNVRVFWVLQPNAPEVDARRERIGYNAQYEAYVRDCQRRYPSLVVIDGRHINYPCQVFTDPVHLDRHGATAYSLGVAEVLWAHLGQTPPSQRWFALPDRRAEAAGFPLEDSIQSSLALKAEQEKMKR